MSEKENLLKDMNEDEYKSKILLAEKYLKILYPKNKQKVKELSERLIEKYGIYAPNLLKSAICTPKYLNQDLGHTMQSSVKTVDYLLSDDVDMSKVAKALNISEEKLVGNARVAAKREEVTEESPKSKIKEEIKQEIKQQSLEAGNNLPVSTKEGLLSACWDVFGARRGSGSNLRMHLDPKGYPTIAAGHLVMDNHPNATYRARHIEKMSKLGISKEQATTEFDEVAKAMRNGTIKTQKIKGVDVIIYPKLTPLTEEQAKKLFAMDVERFYQNVLKNFPDVHKYPIEVQTLIVHNAYHFGSTDNLKKACGKDLSPKNIVLQAANLRIKSGECSINTACEIDSAGKAVDVILPDSISKKIKKYSRSAENYNKNILALLKSKSYYVKS